MALYFLGYKFYAKYLAERIFKLDPNAPVPSRTMEDGTDYVPTNKYVLFGHHFASIAGAAPIVKGRPVKRPRTIATAIRIGNPASWKQAEAARDESGGLIDAVTDDEILAAYRRVAAYEGIFIEPASAASLAGLVKMSAKKDFSHSRVVCVFTGHGLKDPDLPARYAEPPTRLPSDLPTVEHALFG